MADAKPLRLSPPPLDDACALFLDVDGTLVDFDVDPAGVRVLPRVRQAIGAISERLHGAVALVSGRPLAQLDALFAPLRLPAAGLHGHQCRAEAEAEARMDLPAGIPAFLHELHRQATHLAAAHPGLRVEDKGVSLALHWRAAPNAAAAVAGFAGTRIASLPGYRLQPGDHVIEFVPEGADKGLALERMMTRPPFTGRVPVFVGDDLTDEYGLPRPTAPAAGACWSAHAPAAPRPMRWPAPARCTHGCWPMPAPVDGGRPPRASAAGRPQRGSRMQIPVHEANLELGVIGNGSFGALVDGLGRVVWSCLPAFDGDPAFCALLSPRQHQGGDFGVELEDFSHAEQAYLANTAVLRTVLHDARGGSLEILDFAPRWKRNSRIYRPVSIVRRITPLAGSPRIRIHLRPLADWGARVPERTWGSNHMRWRLPDFTLRLSTDVPVRFVRDGLPFVLAHRLHLVLGPDEPIDRSISGYAEEALGRTLEYWREWVRYLSIPLEWQDAVIRSAITLKLCQYEDSGAIIAAMTSSIPEAPDSSRNWDYRYCWLRDAAFVVRALNRLGATRSMEEFLRYIFNIATHDGSLQPLYGIGFEEKLDEHEVESLAGYRGMGPVRRGNLAWVQKQHDVYGSVVLASTQLFFDRRLVDPGDASTFARLEPLGERAFALHDVPDAGLWEFRGRAEVHTYTAAMCWAACDRLARIALRLGLDGRAGFWRGRAEAIRATLLERAWRDQAGHFSASFQSDYLDASLLLLADIGFVAADDPRYVATVEAVGRELRHGDGMFRYVAPDDFGTPETSFTVCTFWYIDALAAIGRTGEARELFERVLARRNRLGLLSEDMAFDDGEGWGNFPQTYSHVGLIIAAMRLSRSWQEAS